MDRLTDQVSSLKCADLNVEDRPCIPPNSIESLTSSVSLATDSTTQDVSKNAAIIAEIDVHKCANCKAPAKACCAGCSNIPRNVFNSLEYTFYCNKECQKSDWAEHKITCKTNKFGVDLVCFFRAARYLSSAHYMYRQFAFDVSVEAVEMKGNTLIVKEGRYKEDEFLVDFPHELVDRGKDKEVIRRMLLTMMTCTDALMSFQRACKMLLIDTKLASKIEEVTFHAKAGKREWELHRSHKVLKPVEIQFHRCFRVTFARDGSLWALDLTEAQYGYDRLLAPWQEYKAERILYIDKVEALGSCYQTWRLFRQPDWIKAICDTDDPEQTMLVHRFIQAKIGEECCAGLEKGLNEVGLTARQFLTRSQEDYDEIAKKVMAWTITYMYSARQHIKDNFGRSKKMFGPLQFAPP